MSETKAKKANDKIRLPDRLMSDLLKEKGKYLDRGLAAPSFGKMLTDAWQCYLREQIGKLPSTSVSAEPPIISISEDSNSANLPGIVVEVLQRVFEIGMESARVLVETTGDLDAEDRNDPTGDVKRRQVEEVVREYFKGEIPLEHPGAATKPPPKSGGHR